MTACHVNGAIHTNDFSMRRPSLRGLPFAPQSFPRSRRRHVWNYFLPRHGGDDIRLFDWDAGRIGCRRTISRTWYGHTGIPTAGVGSNRCSRSFHAALVAYGVYDYDRRALHDDYRLSALLQIMTPVWQAPIDLPPVIWWSHLERILLAIDDLGCSDLLA